MNVILSEYAPRFLGAQSYPNCIRTSIAMLLPLAEQETEGGL